LRAQTLYLQGERAYYGGDLQAARSIQREASRMAEQIGDPLLVLLPKVSLARLDLEQGNTRQAVQALESAVGEAKDLGLKLLATETATYLGAALSAEGETDQARQVLSKALAQSQELSSPPLELKAHHYLAELSRRTGDEALAIEHARSAAALLEEMRQEAASDSLLRRHDLAPIAASS